MAAHSTLKPGPRDAIDEGLTPQRYVVTVVGALWDNLPQVALGGIVFSLWAAPAFVLAVLEWWLAAGVAGVSLAAPAWVALVRWSDLLLGGRVPTWRLLFTGWAAGWFATVRLTVIALFPTLLATRVLPPPPATDATWSLLLYGLFHLYALLWLAIFLLYILPGRVLYGWKPAVAFGNGLVLAGRYPSHTVGLMALFVLSYLTVVRVSGGLIFLLPAILALFVAGNVRLAVNLEQGNLERTNLD